MRCVLSGAFLNSPRLDVFANCRCDSSSFRPDLLRVDEPRREGRHHLLRARGRQGNERDIGAQGRRVFELARRLCQAARHRAYRPPRLRAIGHGRRPPRPIRIGAECEGIQAGGSQPAARAQPAVHAAAAIVPDRGARRAATRPLDASAKTRPSTRSGYVRANISAVTPPIDDSDHHKRSLELSAILKHGRGRWRERPPNQNSGPENRKTGTELSPKHERGPARKLGKHCVVWTKPLARRTLRVRRARSAG